jgi:hypothetical protein
MSEDRYLSLTQPQALLEWITCWKRRLEPSERKLRLVACACVRFCREGLGDDLDPEVLRAAERWAEGDTSGWELLRGLRADSPLAAVVRRPGREAAACAVRHALYRSRLRVPRRLEHARKRLSAPLLERAARAAEAGAVDLERARQSIARQFRLRDREAEERLRAEDRRGLCDLIRDVLGDPRRPIAVDAAWLDAGRGLARAIAAGIEAEGRFGELPVLGDALEEAGCGDERILAHARQPWHYRGCWLIDAILGKS